MIVETPLAQPQHPAHLAVAGADDPVLPGEGPVRGDDLGLQVVLHHPPVLGMDEVDPALDAAHVGFVDPENGVHDRRGGPEAGHEIGLVRTDCRRPLDFCSFNFKKRNA